MLEERISSLKGVGKKTEEILGKLNIKTIGDLLLHFPQRYIEFTKTRPISAWKEGERAAIFASVEGAPRLSPSSRKILRAQLFDESGKVEAIWYHSPFIAYRLKSMQRYVFVGRLVLKNRQTFLEHPSIYTEEEYERELGFLKPVYPLTAGLSNSLLIRQIGAVLRKLPPQEDYLPRFILKDCSLLTYHEALCKIHQPGSASEAEEAKKRFIFDDFFLFLFYIRRMKEENRGLESAFPIGDEQAPLQSFFKLLPYSPTKDQQNAISEILCDMKRGRVMNRLLQGDVGSGKTMVAAAALYVGFFYGYQGAIMVPTEVLAKQHYQSLEKLWSKAKKAPRTALLTGSMSKAERLEVYERARSHEIDILIGTHALIQEGLEFARLALVITDEQHRFGVRQRESLEKKGSRPHVLVMSATPIPRTLALILYGDLDISTIESKPEGRLPIKNALIGAKQRDKAYVHIQKELQKGHQAYIICPLAEESEHLEAENVFDYREKLAKTALKNYNIDIIHGKMPQNEKDRVMDDFVRGRTNILISTTVIEVGVDVANATVMLIEDAQRFGLASLHQLRGRVGRGKAQSYCIFVGTSDSENAKKRLEIIANSNDGFYIAAQDLKLRGPGELFGLMQSGELMFSLGDICDDTEIFAAAERSAAILHNQEIILSDIEKEKLDQRILRYRQDFRFNL